MWRASALPPSQSEETSSTLNYTSPTLLFLDLNTICHSEKLNQYNFVEGLHSYFRSMSQRATSMTGSRSSSPKTIPTLGDDKLLASLDSGNNLDKNAPLKSLSVSGITTSEPLQTQPEQMRRRRSRESHNLAERRRRNNINDRIHELSHLVPLHRLEDEQVRKGLLSGGSTITNGIIPIEERGPNKGEILNAAPFSLA